jgi:hypothetical protein
LSLGIISSLFFFALNSIGPLLRPDYNSITEYISELTADGAPYVMLMRFFANTSYLSLLLFAICLTIVSFAKHRTALRVGFSLLVLIGLASALGYGTFPMTTDMLISPQNIIHVAITIVIIMMTVTSVIFISWGFLKQERLIRLGKISLITAIAFIFFNLVHLAGIILQSDMLGLWQRLGIYTFYIYVLVLSWTYVFAWQKSFNPDHD